MLTKFILPVAVLFSAPLLSHATPFGWGPPTVTVTATLTIFQCPTSSALVSSSAIASSSSALAVSSSASASASSGAADPSQSAGGDASIAQVIDLLNGLRQFSSLLPTVENLVPTLLNTVSSIVSNILGSITGPTNQLQNGLNTLVNQLGTLSSQAGIINTILTNLANGVASPTNGNDVYNGAQGGISQLTGLINKARTYRYDINILITSIQGCHANINLSALQTTLWKLQQQLSIMYPSLSNQCGTPAQSQALTTAYRTFDGLLQKCAANAK
ncbi:hypothetical protein B0H13DRAFT_2356047 [Mycena leptocephala]|nr:hypothetical protein B0H13DRAFT_2356047 [Mycena leptocephala]